MTGCVLGCSELDSDEEVFVSITGVESVGMILQDGSSEDYAPESRLRLGLAYDGQEVFPGRLVHVAQAGDLQASVYVRLDSPWVVIEASLLPSCVAIGQKASVASPAQRAHFYHRKPLRCDDAFLPLPRVIQKGLTFVVFFMHCMVLLQMRLSLLPYRTLRLLMLLVDLSKRIVWIKIVNQ